MALASAQRLELLALGRQSIESALRDSCIVALPPQASVPGLEQRCSSFVTLHIEGRLRGCCGSIEATRPLAEDVWHNARASAFSDPRFAALTSAEWTRTDLHISVLSTPEPLIVADEAALLRELRPNLDGLILQLGAARATFLPAVWEQLPEPQLFLRQLKLKAGWHQDFWSPQIRVMRYTTESFGEEETR